MPHQLQKLTPNLVVSDITRSLAFYRDVLGFSVTFTVPEQAPFVFAAVQSGPIEVFLNASGPALEEYPAFKERPIGGTFTMFIEVGAVKTLYATLSQRATVVMPLEKKWYGMTEFAIEDPDGYIITFAERG